MRKNHSQLFTSFVVVRAIILVVLLSLMSCVNLRLDIKKEFVLNEEMQRTLILQKIAFLKVNYDDNSDSNLSKNKKVEMKRVITQELISWLKLNYSFQDVKEYPSNISEIPANIVVLSVGIDEKNVQGEYWWNIAARTLSLGFYRQYIAKEINYSLEVQNTKELSVSPKISRFEAVYGYQAPFVIVPLNLDKHPFSLGAQARVHLDKLRLLIGDSLQK